VQRRERRRRSRRSEGVSALTELGFSRRDASRALQHADGDVDRAYQVSVGGSTGSVWAGPTGSVWARPLCVSSADPAGL